ncbi:MAG: radical SAM family heme chaperone HemW [Anditalea sp.]
MIFSPLSGIYIHIPFCKQACHYCDFHFSTNIDLKDKMVQMICKELELQKLYLGEKAIIKTIYFGGGTPSLLSSVELGQILNTLHQYYRLEIEELTIETNPDDLTPYKLIALKELGFDRLSIGIQSFNDKVLKFYNRAHTAEESLRALEKAKNARFEKFSIDLMYGFPNTNHNIWKNDLKKAIELDPGHISSYGLTIEPKTALGRWAEKGSFTPPSEDFIAEQFEIMQDELEKAGYVQYEISNFGKPGAFAIHNTNYWVGIPYLGVGPSAHSFDGKSRQHNPSNNSRYIKSLEKGSLIFEREEIDKADALNEYLLTSLRTIWGADVTFIKNKYQVDLVAGKSKEIQQLVEDGFMGIKDQKLSLTRKGKLLADSIALKLFV